MCNRIKTAVSLGLMASLLAFPAFARTDILLIGTPSSGEALDAFRTSLKTGFGLDDVQVVRPSNSHEVAQRVRDYLGAIGNPDELRVLLITGNEAICPSIDEAQIRPLSRTLIIAPPCIKLLIQAPTTYERFGAEIQDDRGENDQRAPGVGFVSVVGDLSNKPAGLITKAVGSLSQTLACRRSDQISLDFSPSVSAWGINTSLCESSPQATTTVHPPAFSSSQEVKTLVKTQEVTATAGSAAQDEALKLAAPVNGKVITAFGAEINGKPNKGEDIEVTTGTVVKAAEMGEVVFVGELSGYGQVVAIKHDNDWATIYAHTSHTHVTLGQKVRKGQELSDVDLSNKLHFEIRRKGKPIDPGTMITFSG